MDLNQRLVFRVLSAAGQGPQRLRVETLLGLRVTLGHQGHMVHTPAGFCRFLMPLVCPPSRSLPFKKKKGAYILLVIRPNLRVSITLLSLISPHPIHLPNLLALASDDGHHVIAWPHHSEYRGPGVHHPFLTVAVASLLVSLHRLPALILHYPCLQAARGILLKY